MSDKELEAKAREFLRGENEPYARAHWEVPVWMAAFAASVNADLLTENERLKLEPGERCPLCDCPATDGRKSVTHDIAALEAKLAGYEAMVGAASPYGITVGISDVEWVEIKPTDRGVFRVTDSYCEIVSDGHRSLLEAYLALDPESEVPVLEQSEDQTKSE